MNEKGVIASTEEEALLKTLENIEFDDLNKIKFDVTGKDIVSIKTYFNLKIVKYHPPMKNIHLKGNETLEIRIEPDKTINADKTVVEIECELITK